jgi:hypothetical protein
MNIFVSTSEIKVRMTSPVHYHLVFITVCGCANVAEFNVNIVLDPGLQSEHSEFLLRSRPKERVAASLTRPVIDQELSVDV